ncbi:MGDG synthase family glycosyltransferase [Steroidobacter denitrificans]|uniref:MGDG synthase family glycosyltransferase n=1 Tax=Steroidobacter denitrificans TaxID=465721 RepID=UPI001AF01461|nr:glycosyltransferase [Steroidobacter denitrificans]
MLLTSGLGLGHVRAAQAIEAALRDRADVFTVDLWSLMNASVARAVQATYLSLVQNYPQLYERLYHLDERTWRLVLEKETGPPPDVLQVLELISGIAANIGTDEPRGGRYGSDKLLLSLLCAALPYDGDSLAGNGVRARLALMKWVWLRLIRRLDAAIRKISPQLIISTQMVPAAMAARLKRRGKLRVPIIGVMTDFGVHDFWKQRGMEHYCLAHESNLGSIGMPEAREYATGVPLMPDFSTPMPQGEARRRLGLPLNASVVLVLGGGLGLSVDGATALLLQRRTRMHVIAMPGRNQAARSELARLEQAHRLNLSVCDWTDRMDIYLRAADLVVGKPGGITVAESLACGRPLLASRSLGGQEGFNVDFLQRHGVGGLIADDVLLDRVHALLSDHERLNLMQSRAWRLGHRDGASQIAALALELVMQRQSLAWQTP